MRVLKDNSLQLKCDSCGEQLERFKYIKLVGLKLVPGELYPKVSSDSRTKQVDKVHLCEECYEDLMCMFRKK